MREPFFSLIFCERQKSPQFWTFSKTAVYWNQVHSPLFLYRNCNLLCIMDKEAIQKLLDEARKLKSEKNEVAALHK